MRKLGLESLGLGRRFFRCFVLLVPNTIRQKRQDIDESARLEERRQGDALRASKLRYAKEVIDMARRDIIGGNGLEMAKPLKVACGKRQSSK